MNQISILIVEDDIELNRLIQKKLQREGFQTDFAYNVANAIEKMAAKPADILLLDYRLGDKTCKDVIIGLKHINQDPTFIVMTGQGDEKIAVEMLRLGAKDYIFKDLGFIDILSEIIHKVCSSLEREEKLYLAEQAIKESERKFRTLTESSPNGIFESDINGNLNYVNSRLLEITGFKYDDIINKGWQEGISNKELKIAFETLNRNKNKNKSSVNYNFKFQFKKPDFNLVWINGNVCSIKNKAGKISGYIGTIIDVTQQVQSEERLKESEEKYKSVIERAQDSIGIIINKKIVYVNNSLLELLGYSRKKIIGSYFTDYLFPEDVPLLSKRYEMRMRGENIPSIYETSLRRKDGKRVSLEINAGIIPYEGKTANLIFMRDITERKLADQALKDSEDRFRVLFEQAPYPMFLMNIKGDFVEGNFASKKLLGYDKANLIGNNFLKTGLLHLHDIPKALKNLSENIQGKSSGPDEYLLYKKDKSIVEAEIVTHPIKIKRKTHILGIARDITERKKIELELKERRDFAESLIDTSQAIILVLDTQGNIIHFNPYMEDLSGYKINDVQGKNWFGIFVKEDIREDVKKRFISAIQKKHTEGYINPITTKRGKQNQIEWHNKVLTNEKGKVTGLLAIGHDITERLKTEYALKESESHFRSLLENASDYIIFRLSISLQKLQTKVMMVSPSIATIAGLNLQDVFDFSKWFVNVHPDDIKSVLEAKKRAFFPPFRFDEIIKYNHPKKGIRWFHVKSNGVTDNKGKIKYINGIILDITEQRIAEEALRKSEERYRAVAETSIAGITIINKNEEIVFVNKAFANMLGYSRKELLGVNLSGLSDKYEYEKYKQYTSQRIKGARDFYEANLNHKKGHPLSLLVSASPLTSNAGKFVGTLGVIINITERKIAEDQIQKELKEKEVLLAEIHHRVKNNMQIIVGLLALQAMYLNDDTAKKYFQESQDRIQSMSLVHEYLYQSDYFSEIEIENYIRYLSELLFKTYNIDISRIKLIIEAPKIHVNIETAIHCGLIINELITNSLKYAFPDNRQGTITVKLQKHPDNKHILQVIDNGIGIETDNEFDNFSSFGFELIKLLAEGQLKGKLHVDGTKGTKFTITW